MPQVEGFGAELSVDLTDIYDAIEEMNTSRTSMHGYIVELNKIRKRLLGEGIWEGEGAEAVLPVYTATLEKILHEQKRLNALTWELHQYAEELKENELKVVQETERVNIPSGYNMPTSQ